MSANSEELEALERRASECELIADLATDLKARYENRKLATEYRALAQALKLRQPGSKDPSTRAMTVRPRGLPVHTYLSLELPDQAAAFALAKRIAAKISGFVTAADAGGNRIGHLTFESER